MAKPESVTLRVTPEFKALLFQRAKAAHRSMTSYIEWLVLNDARRDAQRAAREQRLAISNPDNDDL